MSDELPESWASATLSELLSALESGSRPRGGVRGIAEGIPSIGGEHLNYSGGFNFESVKYVPKKFAAAMTKGRIQRNDILVVKDGATTGKTAFVDSHFPFDEAFVNEHVFICRPFQEIVPQFLFRFLTSMDGQKRILENFKGSAQGGINQSFAPNTEVPLAPLGEQRRIVAKLTKLLGKVDACQQRLAKIPVLLKRFRQSVLAAACSGRLTADWREENESIETKTERLATIAKINEGKSKREIERAKKLKAEEWFFDMGGELPESWLQVNFMDVTWLITCGVAKRPNYVEKGIPFLSAQNAKPFRANLNDIKFISERDFKTFTVGGKPERNDVLYSRVGAKFGEAAKVTFDFDFAVYVSLTLIKPIHELMNTDFLVAYLNSYYGLLQAHGGVLGSGIQNLNVENVRKFRVPLPPLAEQQEIVRRVEGLFALADQIETRFAKAKEQVDKLTPSLLARAFRGQLVPQDPTDEPAEKLLERIGRYGERKT